ncbi:TIGR04255 family protein [Nocardia sp. NPDC005746]|uniref:TIGR04255 family protein n=1 Tax=Nocardia sp. NPDC005746 TaxID=3157062 RepID=UPI0033C63F55
MAGVVLGSPFGSEPLDEVPLARPPLAQVLAQVRFAKVSQLWVGDAAAREFIGRVGHEYPIFDHRMETGFQIGPDGIQPVPQAAPIWQLQSRDRNWMINFGSDFFSLTALKYTSRSDFVKRLLDSWEVFANVIESVRHERVGIRYTNRISGGVAIDQLPELVRPEMLGEAAASIAPVERRHSISEAAYTLGGREGFHARWGLLPAGAAFDPTVPTVDTPSWVLDMDAFMNYEDSLSQLQPGELAENISHLAGRAYRYFRWTVTEQFLEVFGGSEDARG